MDGDVLSAHCNCMAGLGESCSHIGAILFFVDATVRIRDSKTVTEEKAYWMLPASLKSVPYAEMVDINFTSLDTLKRKFDDKLKKNNETSSEPFVDKKKQSCLEKYKGPSQKQVDIFYKELSLCNSKPAILSIIPPYDDIYIPKQLITNLLPKMLSDIYDTKLLKNSYLELCQHCENIEFSQVTEEQQIAVEELTRKQALSKNWFLYRAGRFTASNVYSIMHCNQNKKTSLINKICYSVSNSFSTQATNYGNVREKKALSIYTDSVSAHHENWKISNCGLFLSTEHFYMGASPDAVVYCSCCGDGCIEIKCPFKHKDDFIFEAVEKNKKFCLQNIDGVTKLSRNHPYYYQIQTQINLCKKKYCDFFIYTEKDYHIERIFPDIKLWEDIIKECEIKFKHLILPELAAKYFTRKLNEENIHLNISIQNCYCNGKEDGELFPCNNIDCLRKLFHLKCLKLINKPNKKWVCPDCKQHSNKK